MPWQIVLMAFCSMRSFVTDSPLRSAPLRAWAGEQLTSFMLYLRISSYPFLSLKSKHRACWESHYSLKWCIPLPSLAISFSLILPELLIFYSLLVFLLGSSGKTPFTLSVYHLPIGKNVVHREWKALSSNLTLPYTNSITSGETLCYFLTTLSTSVNGDNNNAWQLYFVEQLIK